MNVRLYFIIWRGSLDKLSIISFIYRGSMGGFGVYMCGIVLIIEAQYGRLIFDADYKLRMLEKPSHSFYEKDKQIDVSQCDKLDLEIKRLYHTKVLNRGYYNIYRLTVGRRFIYFVERYYKKANIYDYEVFDTFEDAMAYIYS